MSRSRRTEDGLSNLLADVLSAEQPDPALLARYAEHPESLRPHERADLEAQLAQSPALRDQLRVLQSFELPPAAAGPQRWRALIDRIAAFVRRRAVWTLAPAGAVAVLALALFYRTAGVHEEHSVAPVSRPAGFDDSGAAEGRNEKMQKRLRAVPENSNAVQDERDIARFAAEPQAAGQAGTEAKGHAPVAAWPSRDDSARPLIAAPPVTRKMPVAKDMADAAARSRSSTADAVEVTRPVYRAPAPADVLARRQPAEAVGGPDIGQPGLNGPPAPRPDLVALAPPVAYTSAAQPVLLWYLPQPPHPGTQLELTLSDASDPPTSIRKPLALPVRPGVQRIVLAELGLTLAPSTVYRWTIVLHRVPNDTAHDLSVTRRIERVDLPATIGATRQTAPPGEMPAVYAGTGLWYDALDALDDLRRRHPDNASVQNAFNDLLAQIGVTLP